jgi:hypothetical protein
VPATARIRLVEQPGATGRYQPVQFTVAIASPAVTNPFADLRCAGDFIAPSGRRLSIQGFCDADDGATARLRFCPQEIGRYQYYLRCGDMAGEASFTGEFESHPSELPGFVRIDPEYPRHFRDDAGGRPFLAGKTAWVLGASPLWREFLDLCLRQGQNVARLALGGLDYGAGWYGCRWWAERDGRPDLSRFHLPEWQQIDRAIRYGAERGLLFEACIVTGREKVYADGFPIPHPAMERYWDYALARLAAYPSLLLWELFNEYTGQGEYQAYMADYLRRHDPYGRLVTTSGREVGDIPFPEADWNDLVVPHFCTGSDLDLHDFYRAWALRLRAYGKPVYIDETGRAIDGQRNDDGEHRRKQYWIWAMSGAYCNFHSKGGCYVDLTLEPGEEYWPHLVNFWRGTRWHALEPTDELVRAQPAEARAAYALLAPDEAVVYLYCVDDRAVAGGRMVLNLPSGGWWAHWYDPKTGCILAVERWEAAAAARAVDVPTFRADLVLHLARIRQ